MQQRERTRARAPHDRSTITDVAFTVAVACDAGRQPQLLDRVARDRGGDAVRTGLDLDERHHAVRPRPRRPCPGTGCAPTARPRRGGGGAARRAARPRAAGRAGGCARRARRAACPRAPSGAACRRSRRSRGRPRRASGQWSAGAASLPKHCIGRLVGAPSFGPAAARALAWSAKRVDAGPPCRRAASASCAERRPHLEAARLALRRPARPAAGCGRRAAPELEILAPELLPDLEQLRAQPVLVRVTAAVDPALRAARAERGAPLDVRVHVVQHRRRSPCG